MRYLNRYRAVLIVILPLILFIVLKEVSPYRFKNNSRKWAEAALSGSNIVSTGEAMQQKGNWLILRLDTVQRNMPVSSENIIYTEPDSVFNRDIIARLHKYRGSILLSSDDPALSARIWMLLSQTGVKNIFLPDQQMENEVFKNKFRPDTVHGPE